MVHRPDTEDCAMPEPLLARGWIFNQEIIYCAMPEPLLAHGWIFSQEIIDIAMPEPLLAHGWIFNQEIIDCAMPEPLLAHGWIFNQEFMFQAMTTEGTRIAGRKQTCGACSIALCGLHRRLGYTHIGNEEVVAKRGQSRRKLRRGGVDECELYRDCPPRRPNRNVFVAEGTRGEEVSIGAALVASHRVSLSNL